MAQQNDEPKVAAGAAIARQEAESQAAIAAMRPRNEKFALMGALQELVDFPDTAAKAYYSIPYRKERGSSEKVMVEGLSIHAALSLMRHWGNCASAARIVDDLPERFVVEAAYVDYQTNIRVGKAGSVSKAIRLSNGGLQWLDTDRLDMRIQSGMSKAQRNAILAGLPTHIKESYFRKAKEVAARFNMKRATAAKVTPGENIAAALAGVGVTRLQLEEYFGKPAPNFDEKDVQVAQGMLNAIRDGHMSVGEIFDDAPVVDAEAVAEGLGKANGAKVEETAPPPQPSPAPRKETPKTEAPLAEGDKRSALRKLFAEAAGLLGGKFRAWRKSILAEYNAAEVDEVKDGDLAELYATVNSQLNAIRKGA